jgi:hypothetical protein
MNVDSRTEAAQFPEKEYLNGIFVAVLAIENRSSKRESSYPFHWNRLPTSRLVLFATQREERLREV